MPASQKDPEGCGPADKSTVVLETAGLNATELSAYRRPRGLYPEQVEGWRQAFQNANEKPVLTLNEQMELEKLLAQDQREFKPLKQELRRKEKAQVEAAALLIAGKNDPGLLGRGRGRLTPPGDRRKTPGILDEDIAAGARASELARLLVVDLSTLQRWRRQFTGVDEGTDRSKGSPLHVAHRLTDEERQRILLSCNQEEFAALPAGQIVPVLADRGVHIASERNFFHVLHAHAQAPPRSCRSPSGATVAARKMPAPGRVPSWPGTTTSTATAPSGS